jgi:hypothetical protein
VGISRLTAAAWFAAPRVLADQRDTQIERLTIGLSSMPWFMSKMMTLEQGAEKPLLKSLLI